MQRRYWVVAFDLSPGVSGQFVTDDHAKAIREWATMQDDDPTGSFHRFSVTMESAKWATVNAEVEALIWARGAEALRGQHIVLEKSLLVLNTD